MSAKENYLCVKNEQLDSINIDCGPMQRNTVHDESLDWMLMVNEFFSQEAAACV